MQCFTQEELKGLEKAVFEEPFTCDSVVRLIDGVREVFHKNRGNLHEYVCDVDHYFDTTLFDLVCGFEHVGVKHTETLKLDLQKLLFLRENGMPVRNELKRTESMYSRILAKAKKKLKTLFSPSIPYEQRLEKITQEMEDKAGRYEKLKQGKYKKFFEQAQEYNWVQYHAEFELPLALIPAELSNPDTAPLIPVVDRFLRVVAAERVNAQVMESVYQKNSRMWTTNQYSGAPSPKQASVL